MRTIESEFIISNTRAQLTPEQEQTLFSLLIPVGLVAGALGDFIGHLINKHAMDSAIKDTNYPETIVPRTTRRAVLRSMFTSGLVGAVSCPTLYIAIRSNFPK